MTRARPRRPLSSPRRPDRRSRWLTAVVANARGDIIDLVGYAAVGMAGAARVPLEAGHTRPLPHGSELMQLPGRRPVVFNLARNRLTTLHCNPYAPDETVHPVAVFNSPGYVATHISAYEEAPGADPLPLFSYGAVGWHAGGFRSAALRVDREPRQDLRRMPLEGVRAGIAGLRGDLADNRLRAHLETCALSYGCPAGKNFFLGRYEAPLPTSRACNARCLGCLSLQTGSGIPSSQHRLAFTPDPREIAEVALAHINRVKRAVVSFGQGCEGEPLLAATVIVPAIARIRAATTAGTINLNTNASRPQDLARMLDAGLDSLRVSLNSVREVCYKAYFRPQGYGFDDVCASIALARERGAFVALNYLNMAGVTDAPAEVEALEAFLARHPVDLIQWRNLNYDPLAYYRVMGADRDPAPPLGLAHLLARIRRCFPTVACGYFNPPKERYRRWRADPATIPALEGEAR